jgi:hypothetical protein
MGGGIVGTVTAGERVDSTGPQVAGLFFVHAKFRQRHGTNFSPSITQLDSFRIAAGVFMARSGCFS